MKVVEQIPILFPEDNTAVLLPVSLINFAVKARKKIYNKHVVNLKKLDLETVLFYDRIKPVKKQWVPVIEHRALERTTIIYDLDELTIYTGCIYHFLIWFNGVTGRPLEDGVDACITVAKNEVKKILEKYK